VSSGTLFSTINITVSRAKKKAYAVILKTGHALASSEQQIKLYIKPTITTKPKESSSEHNHSNKDTDHSKPSLASP